MKIKNIKKIKKMKVEMEGAKGVYKQIPISKKDGAPLFSFRVFTLKPKGHTPFHNHPFEHLNYAMEGRGCLVDKKGNKTNLKKGDFALIKPNEYHQYKNTSLKNDFIMICAVPKEYE